MTAGDIAGRRLVKITTRVVAVAAISIFGVGTADTKINACARVANHAVIAGGLPGLGTGGPH